MVKFLINNGADVNLVDKTGSTPLMLAVSGSDISIVTMLLSAGANSEAVNLNGDTAISLAVNDDNEAIIGEFIISGIDPGKIIAQRKIKAVADAK